MALQLPQRQVFSTIKLASFPSFWHFKHEFLLSPRDSDSRLMSFNFNGHFNHHKYYTREETGTSHIFKCPRWRLKGCERTRKLRWWKMGKILSPNSSTRGTQEVAFLLCLICMCHNTLDYATNMLCNNSESSTIL